jgi:hypothetical protein
MKLKFGRGNNRLFEVNAKTDYVFTNNACAFLASKDGEKTQFRNWDYIHDWTLSKRLFQKLLKGGFIEKTRVEREYLTYFHFTEKALVYPGEFH